MNIYRFRQNNSGGVFEGPEFVFIEAETAEQANEIAKDKHGIYFDGCDKDIDCDCCGDRWRYVDEYDTVSEKEAMEQELYYPEHGIIIYYADGREYTAQ